LRVSIVNVPPGAIASRLFTARFQDDLLDLVGVRQHSRQVGVSRGHQAHGRAEEAPQHLLHVRHAVIEAHRFGIERLPATERQQLARQRRRPIARLEDFVEVLRVARIRAKVFPQDVRVSNDRRQQVVEIVRDAPPPPPARLPSASSFWACTAAARATCDR